MGYNAYGAGTVTITDAEAAKAALKARYNVTGDDINRILDSLDSGFYFQDGDWLVYDSGANYHDDEEFEILSTLAPYVKNGSEIRMSGEDDSHWRFIFKDGRVMEEGGTVSYGLEEFTTEELTAELQKRTMTHGRKIWLVGISNTGADGVILNRICATTAQIKKYLVDCVKSDRKNDLSGWDTGTDKVADIHECDGRLEAYGIYGDYHIDYTATEEKSPLFIGGAKNKEDEKHVSV